jgi:hypothetical protein
MALTRKNRIHKYNDQECWEHFMVVMCGGASHGKLRSWLWETRKMKVSQMGAFWSMWRWAIRHPEQTFPQYKKWYFETASGLEDGIDPNVSFEDYLIDLKKHARIGAVGRAEYRQFCETYNL